MNSGKNNKLWNSESYKKTNTSSNTKNAYQRKPTGTIGGKDTQTKKKIKKRTSTKNNEKGEEKSKKENEDKKIITKEIEDNKLKNTEIQKIEAQTKRIESDKEKELKFKLLNDKIKELEIKSKECSQMNEEIKKLNDTIKSEYKKHDELQLNIKKIEEENKLLKNKLKDDTNKKNDELQLNLKKLEEENKLLKSKLKEETDKKNDELQVTLKKIEDENKLLKNQLKEEINKNKELNSELIKNKNTIKNTTIKDVQKIKRIYDIEIRMESLKDLIFGWEIKYGSEGMNKYLNMRNKELLLIGILGLKNKGKSYILSKLLKENEYKKEDDNNLYLKYITDQQKNFNYAIIDTPGIGKYLIRKENYASNNYKIIKELEKYNNQTDNFLINFILKKSNFIICIVGLLDYNEQNLINKLKLKDEEYKKEYKKLKKIFIIHNLKELSTKEEIKNYINNVLLKSLTFNIVEKEGNLAQNTSSKGYNTKYFIEKNINEELEIYHLITAKENTEAGNYYNEFTYTFLIQQYNSFHYFNKFDIIKEMKEEIQFISKNILTQPIKSLDDFENTDNKIKLKNKFEFFNNPDENANSDFSYFTLKPKYSYYKINNNSQLLIVIEMPGQIIDQKFVCDKVPKNGYYTMTFSGKKVVNLPDNIEEQKKSGDFYSNIDGGEFKEIIKINVQNYQLASTKYKQHESEKNGIHKYYFDIVKNTDTIESDD